MLSLSLSLGIVKKKNVIDTPLGGRFSSMRPRTTSGADQVDMTKEDERRLTCSIMLRKRDDLCVIEVRPLSLRLVTLESPRGGGCVLGSQRRVFAVALLQSTKSRIDPHVDYRRERQVDTDGARFCGDCR